MAPRRKRTTGRKDRSTRAKPKLPEGKLDSSMTVEERENKLSDYINDYQLQVNSKLEKMRKCVSTVKSLVANIYRSALIQLPKSVKQMTMGEFMRLGGTIDSAINAQVTECINGFVTTSIPMTSSTSTDRIPLSNVFNTVDLTASCVDEANNAETSSSVRTAGKTGRKRKVKITEETPANKKPVFATATRSSRRLKAKTSTTNNEVTPMPNMNNQSMLQTPFITPKFDPRLPFTPAIMREPKAGERIVSMCGSPLTNPAGPHVEKTAPQVFIPLKGGKTMQLSVDDKPTMMSEFNVANDNVALQNIKLLQEKLSLLLKMPKNMH